MSKYKIVNDLEQILKDNIRLKDENKKLKALLSEVSLKIKGNQNERDYTKVSPKVAKQNQAAGLQRLIAEDKRKSAE